MRKRILLTVAVLLIAGCACVAWTLAGLPPPKYYLRYGLDPYCEPTGEKVTLEGVEFIEIGPGIFRMGSTYYAEGGDWLGKICAPFGLPWGEHPRPSEEKPIHWVEFPTSFWIATTEVTNLQYERFTGPRRRHLVSEEDHGPVVAISWSDAQAFCRWLGDRGGMTGRLPREAEWECAARAGCSDEYCFGNDAELLVEYGVCGQKVGAGAEAVASRKPNQWGLFDMYGNVSELCEDAFPVDPSDYSRPARAWVTGLRPGPVVRGGFWAYPPEGCRSASRSFGLGDSSDISAGFRPVLSCPSE